MTSSLHTPVVTTVDESFDLAASARFLAEFAPAARRDAAEEPGVLRLAFPVDGTPEYAGVAIRQRAPGSVEFSLYCPDSLVEAVIGQTRRILSLDFDATGFREVARIDPVLGAARAASPGLRPVLFASPYEAACWAVIASRIRMTQAATLKERIAERWGATIEVEGRPIACFPTPAVLAEIDEPMGVSGLKVARLRAIARAAGEGALDADTLRSSSPEEALAHLQTLPGVGPFSAELILARGAGHSDVFPGHEPRLHTEMREAYQLPEASVPALTALAEAWRPHRTWASFLFRIQREARRV